jgi:uncharacterized membrane protein
MTLFSTDENRFPVAMALALLVVAMVGSSIMSWAEVDKGQISTILLFTIGFAGMLLNQSRIGSIADMKVEDIKTTLITNNESVAKVAAISDKKQSNQLNRVESITRSTHGLVNGAHLAALKTIAEQADRIASLTGKSYDRELSDIANANLNDYNAKLMSDQVRKEGES